jgi:hypothetical protein
MLLDTFEASWSWQLVHWTSVPCGMRVVLDGRVAVITRQNTVDAGSMLGRINRNAFAASRSHAWLAVTGKAVCVLLDGNEKFLRYRWDGRECGAQKQ